MTTSGFSDSHGSKYPEYTAVGVGYKFDDHHDQPTAKSVYRLA
jgi:hypothetical protein